MKPEVIESGKDGYLNKVWELKEEIRRTDGYLRQSWEFFSRSYRRNKDILILNHEQNGENPVVGFATVRNDGYILFLGVHPEYRNKGIGKTMIAEVLDEGKKATCHTRASNKEALDFYQNLGFEIDRYIESYYQNGDSAYYLKRNTSGAQESIKSKIKKAIDKTRRH